jgi:hypothetical protein
MKIEPIDFIMSNGLDFCSGNIIKYAARWDKKGEPLADLEKIISYANILIKEVRKG